MRKLIFLFFPLFVLSSSTEDLPTVSYVNIPQYLGHWYAISALPQRFTRKCSYQTATYSKRNESSINLVNGCVKENGRIKRIRGKAVIKNFDSNAELIVSFRNFFTWLFRVRGDYNIMALDENYQYVMVGGRDRKSLWIMSRYKSIPKDVYISYVKLAKSLGFATNKLKVSKF